jgi:Ran GTPase-activating protein (RanGAP) involved in mRNA processing and transport
MKICIIPWNDYVKAGMKAINEADFELERLVAEGFVLDQPIHRHKVVNLLVNIFAQAEEGDYVDHSDSGVPDDGEGQDDGGTDEETDDEEENDEDIQELSGSPQRSEERPSRNGHKGSSKKLSGQKRRGKP